MKNLKFTRSGLPKKLGTYLGAFTLGAVALLLPACQADEIEEGRTNVTTEDIVEGTTEGEVTNQTATDQELVTVRSPIGERIGDADFVLETDTGEPILVVNTTGEVLTPPSADVPVQVTGKIATFVIADIEAAYGLDLDETLYVDYENQPALIAESVALAPKPEDLATNPEPYFDQVIAIEGEVGALYSDNSFSLYEEGWVDDIGLIVIGTSPDLLTQAGSTVDEGEIVTVTGRIRPFDIAVLDEEYDTGWDENEIGEIGATYNEVYTQRPVIVADGVYPSALDN